jgi:hypothetical protein
MLGLPSRCTRVWTIVPHVRRRVKSPTLPRYTWVVGFISLEQTSSIVSNEMHPLAYTFSIFGGSSDISRSFLQLSKLSLFKLTNLLKHVGMITISLPDRSNSSNLEEQSNILKIFDSNRTRFWRLNFFSSGKTTEEQPSLETLELVGGGKGGNSRHDELSDSFSDTIEGMNCLLSPIMWQKLLRFTLSNGIPSSTNAGTLTSSDSSEQPPRVSFSKCAN